MSFAAKREVADADYLLERAAIEVRNAEAVSGPASEAHHKLASRYLDVLFGQEAEAQPESHPFLLARERYQAIKSAVIEFGGFLCSEAQNSNDDEMQGLLSRLS